MVVQRSEEETEIMKWWYKLCDKAVEKASGVSNNAGHFGFRIKCICMWYAVVAFAALLVSQLAFIAGCTVPHLAAVAVILVGLLATLSVFQKNA